MNSCRLNRYFVSAMPRTLRGIAETGRSRVAALAGRMSAETVRALAEESSGPVGRLLGIPVDGEDATVKGLTTVTHWGRMFPYTPERTRQAPTERKAAEAPVDRHRPQL